MPAAAAPPSPSLHCPCTRPERRPKSNVRGARLELHMVVQGV